jgi:hypothetical protein
MTFPRPDARRDRFVEVPYEDKSGSHPGRYYQDIAIEPVLQATGTGKTFIARPAENRHGPLSRPSGDCFFLAVRRGHVW